MNAPPLPDRRGRIKRRSGLALLVAAALPAPASGFDHEHRAWTRLLGAHVRQGPGGVSSRLSYRGLLAERCALQAYLHALSAVAPAQFQGWGRAQQLAFLINAYNAFTVERVLGAYPGLASIKELGKLFQSPWKQRFVALLGQTLSLDDIEHGLIRAPGRFDEARIHFALVCASASCPMLRNEAFVATRLPQQLEDGLRRFLSDRSRNLEHLDYDWSLNDAR